MCSDQYATSKIHLGISLFLLSGSTIEYVNMNLFKFKILILPHFTCMLRTIIVIPMLCKYNTSRFLFDYSEYNHLKIHHTNKNNAVKAKAI